MIPTAFRLIKRSTQYFGRFWRLIIVVVLMDLAGAAIALLSPWPFKLIVDGILSNADSSANESSKHLLEFMLGWASPQSQILILCGLMVVISAATSSIAYISGRLSLNIGLKAIVSLRSHLYEALQYLPLKYHENIPSSDSTYRVAYDSQSIQTIYNGVFIPVTTSFFTLLGSLIVMVKLNILLAMVSIGVIPPVFLCIRYYTRQISAYSIRRAEVESALLGTAQEVLSSVKLVKAHSKEKYELERFLRSAEQSRYSTYIFTKAQIKSGLVITFTMSVGTTVLYYVGSMQVLQKSLSLGGVLVFIAYLTQLYRPIEYLSGIAGTFAAASASLSRSLEVIDRYEDMDEDKSLPAIKVLGGKIVFGDVSFAYQNGWPVLNHMNLSIDAGEVVAVVGQTGQGKSTLLSLLSRFYEPQGGSISIDDQDIAQFSKESVRNTLSIVLQDTVLFSSTIAENIRYGRLEASFEEVREAAARADAFDFIMKLPHGFDTQIGERGGRLSGGQRQRIAIARAFLRDTPILLLDEPTSSLDTITEQRITGAIYELMKNRTTLLVTHRLSLAECADKVAVLDSGMISEMGRPNDLRHKDGLYASLLKSVGRPV